MLRIGAAGRQVDVIVGAAGLARVDAAGRVVGRWPARCRLARARLRDDPPRLQCMTESCIATCSRRPLPLRARSNRALTMLRAISMPVPVSPIVGFRLYQGLG